MTSHPSPNRLERLSVGDLPEALAGETSAHVSECATCRRYADELDRAREARLSAVPPETFVAQVAARRDRGASIADARRRRLVPAVLTLAAAAAAALLLLSPRPDPHVTLKGAGITIYRNRGGEVRVLGSEDRIRAGDALRIMMTLPRPSPVTAWFVDTRGRVDSLLGEASPSLPAGEQPFPDSAIVESPCLDLRLVVVLGPSARGEIPPPGAITRTLRCE